MLHPQQANTCPNPVFDEHRWIMQIRRTLEEPIRDEDDDIHVSIFTVPKPLRDTNPNAYTPQLVALGPYHHWHPPLQDMERYKLSSTKRLRNQNPSLKFNTIVDRLTLLESQIRARYHKYLDVNGETLAWIMVIDASFLLEVMSIYAIQEGDVIVPTSSRMPHLIDYARRKSSSHNAILRDVIMLENQIPMFVLREILGFLHASMDLADEILRRMLVGLYEELSPFKYVIELSSVQSCTYEHLLNFFYRHLVPALEEIVHINDHPITDQEAREEKTCCTFLFKMIKKIISTLPWVFIHNLPVVTILKALLLSKVDRQENLDKEINSRIHKSPLVEEITIPSVVDLTNSGVTFYPTTNDIMSIKFDPDSKRFYLPIISLDFNSEVLFRNLVAYEASIGSGSLIFSRYTELMNGIIDTKDDARVLRERGIILNYLKSDQEVADLWNGMNRALKLTRVPFLDEVIENVNKYYECNWRVRARKVFKAYATNSWDFLIFLVVILVLFMFIGQLLCPLLHCSNMNGAHVRK